ncbi:MOSC and FAD-binding oxidoreductase domain-containing protein [Actinoallomurus vinaceus]|uniref:MOSC and FAD-binding oxidoreductase domain-containing protein n=1 Tax=Actinoallomurus vinaceus TaxID=1080074 RepID=A0ABP8UKR0_9ACTN
MAKLLAVNVGMPKDVPWHGRTVHTGVWKQPVAGPRMVRRLNIDGDGQGDLAGHGGEHRAVLVYQLDSYRHWQEQLGRDDFGYGQFGENFTVDGLPDDEVCIGDRYRIGEALFEVTQPRVTCYRVGMRLEEPRMAALLVSHRRPGFYLRVLTEGRVEAGDEIVKVADGPEGVTVAEIDALLYLPGHPRDQLARALRIPALSPGWKTSLQALLDQADGAPGQPAGNPGLTSAAGPPPAWDGFRPLRVARIDAESTSVFSLTLAAVDGAPLPAASAGQFLTLRLRPGDDAPPLIRSYSLSGPPGAARYRISVKQEPHGAASTHLRTRVRVGDVLDFAAPRGSFTLKTGGNPVLLVSAGIGATPVLAMLHALVAERSTREVWWLYGARDGTEHPFAQESRDLLARLANAHRRICYSRPAPGDRKDVDYGTAGRLSVDLFRHFGVPRGADAYLCGPPAFMCELPTALAASDLAPERVHTEIFGAGPALTPGLTDVAARSVHAPAGPPGTGPAVSFARSGLTVGWDPAYTSLLELAEACDVPTRWSCRTGVCHNCESGLLSGAVTYSPDPVEPPAEGNVLICCSRPRADLVLDL